ncbi:HNH endonuclease [Clostridium botulinum]
MAKEFAKPFYKSKEWQRCREGFIKSVYGLCNRCGKPGYIVHHKIKLTPQNINNTYVTLSWDNLEYLCHDCHNKEHMSKDHKVIREGLMFNDKGEVIKIEKGYTFCGIDLSEQEDKTVYTPL